MQPLLTQRQASEMLALSERTIERLRGSGLGPKFVRCGRSIRCRQADLEAWIDRELLDRPVKMVGLFEIVNNHLLGRAQR